MFREPKHFQTHDADNFHLVRSLGMDEATLKI